MINIREIEAAESIKDASEEVIASLQCAKASTTFLDNNSRLLVVAMIEQAIEIAKEASAKADDTLYRYWQEEDARANRQYEASVMGL